MSKLFSVAREFVRLARDGADETPVAPKRLQGLLWFAQAWSVAVRRCDLFWERFQATPGGPVIPELAAVGDERFCAKVLPEGPPLSEDEKDFLLAIWQRYGMLAAPDLARAVVAECPWNTSEGFPVDLAPAVALADGPVPASILGYTERHAERVAEAERRIAAIGFDPAAFAAQAKRVTARVS